MKDFDKWNEEKKRVHEGKNINFARHFVNVREIWYVSLGVNVGYEQDGKAGFKRPVLVLQKIGSMFVVVPLTTQGKQNSTYYYELISPSFHKDSYIITSQMRTLDKKRFFQKIGIVSKSEFGIIKNLPRKLYFPED